MVQTGSPRDLTIRGNLQKNQIYMTRYFLCDTFEIDWSRVLLKLGNVEVLLATSVTIPLLNKHRVKCIMDNNEIIYYNMLLLK